MPQPTPYTVTTDFSQEEATGVSGRSTVRTAAVDVEFDNLAVTLADILANLLLIQRDDGALADGVVSPASLSTATKALMTDWNPRGAWVTATAYAVADVVENSSVSYVCAVAHTSGVFATDRTNGKWVVLGNATGAFTALATSSDAYPAGGIAATNVQAAIQELADERAKLAGLSTQTFSVADATDKNHAVGMGQAQKNSLVFAVGTGTGDTIAATIASTLAALVDGMEVCVRSPGANSATAPTLELTLGATSTGAIAIVSAEGGTALAAGDIVSGHEMVLRYNATAPARWRLLNPKRPTGAAIGSTAWVDSGLPPTYISTTSFSVAGDQTADLQVGRRLKFTVTAGTVYGTIYTSSFAAGVTTVVMAMDSSGNLDSGLTAISWSLLTATNPQLPAVAQQTIASAATVNLASARGPVLHISGNTGPITSFGSAPSGVTKFVIFDSTPTITQNATSMILLGGASRTVAAGDVGIYGSEGGGNWRELFFGRANGAPATMSPITASLGADVALNNTGTFFDGPSIAQGTAGTWFVSGTVTIRDSVTADAQFDCKLWDGTTVIAAAQNGGVRTANQRGVVSLSGILASPAGNLRISVKDASSTSGTILFNSTGTSKDSTITAIRIA